ncbi:hypothetical protein SSX86_024222 [Deinandra increscens subsp. villosa]|uniref:Uncharacterized protein n=1 Tax=Deinandra increscens subsp. villosa TaxID=3103831 RepID=A0AAP0CP51_9ASTR
MLLAKLRKVKQVIKAWAFEDKERCLKEKSALMVSCAKWDSLSELRALSEAELGAWAGDRKALVDLETKERRDLAQKSREKSGEGGFTGKPPPPLSAVHRQTTTTPLCSGDRRPPLCRSPANHHHPFCYGGVGGGDPASIPAEPVLVGPSKRQRRPSVRLGEIGDQHTYDNHRRTKPQQWKYSKDSKATKTRQLMNLSGAAAMEYRQTLDAGNEDKDAGKLGDPPANTTSSSKTTRSGDDYKETVLAAQDR